MLILYLWGCKSTLNHFFVHRWYNALCLLMSAISWHWTFLWINILIHISILTVVLIVLLTYTVIYDTYTAVCISILSRLRGSSATTHTWVSISHHCIGVTIGTRKAALQMYGFHFHFLLSLLIHIFLFLNLLLDWVWKSSQIIHLLRSSLNSWIISKLWISFYWRIIMMRGVIGLSDWWIFLVIWMAIRVKTLIVIILTFIRIAANKVLNISFVWFLLRIVLNIKLIGYWLFVWPGRWIVINKSRFRFIRNLIIGLVINSMARIVL